jgi:hypothetical protein
MNDAATIANLMRSAASARFRVITDEGEDLPERSWQRVRCHLHREDVPWAALPLIYALSALSFADARPRGYSNAEYEKREDGWFLEDVLPCLTFEGGSLVFDSDYVRGRMMKTRLEIRANGTVIVETRGRYGMVHRWFSILKGQRQLRLAVKNGRPVE